MLSMEAQSLSFSPSTALLDTMVMVLLYSSVVLYRDLQNVRKLFIAPCTVLSANLIAWGIAGACCGMCI